MAYSFSGGLLLATNMVFYASAPFLLIRLLGISPRDYGLYTAAGVFGFMTGNFIVTRARDVNGTARMQLTGSIISFCGAVLMVVIVTTLDMSVWSLIGPFTIVTLGSGIALPNSVAGSINRYPEIAGTSSSLSGFIRMGLASAATALLGLLHAMSALHTAAFMAGLSGLSVLIALSNPERFAPAHKGAVYPAVAEEQ